ncbi:hypothetical protein D3C76_1299080 [compost metagenome]
MPAEVVDDVLAQLAKILEHGTKKNGYKRPCAAVIICARMQQGLSTSAAGLPWGKRWSVRKRRVNALFCSTNEQNSAQEVAQTYAERRNKGTGKILETPFIFPPSRNSEYIKQTPDRRKQ